MCLTRRGENGEAPTHRVFHIKVVYERYEERVKVQEKPYQQAVANMKRVYEILDRSEVANPVLFVYNYNMRDDKESLEDVKNPSETKQIYFIITAEWKPAGL